MKKNKVKDKTKIRKKKKQMIPGEKISKKIIRDFLRFNLLCLALLLFVYLIIYLASKQYDFVYINVMKYAEILLGTDRLNYVMEHKLITLGIIYAAFFIASCFGYSVSTLVNFNKTWMSLSAILSDDSEIRKFSDKFSDVEIALKDIKHNVFKNQQLAAQSESRKNDLVMYLAHDLKTPLTSIIGYLTLLKECPEIPTDMRAKYIGITVEKAYRLEQLINEFFEITRFNINSVTIERNRIDIGMMLNQIADEFYPLLIEKNIRISIDMKEKIVMFADADKTARVLDNLLKNAVSYSYNNSIIKVGARIIDDKVYIRFRNRCDEIPEEKLERIFEKFFRNDSSRNSSTGGTGLGLAIAKQIVELHGGSIYAKSTKEYTDFTVILPFENADFSDYTEE